MERFTFDLCFFVSAFPLNVAIFHQFFLDLYQIVLGQGDIKRCGNAL